MRVVSTIAGVAIAVLIIVALRWFGPTPTPTRSYDASTGVTCYSIPGAISCVRTGQP